tara:strand:+ start:140 stop:967 length:828 start_codon:yes stop_codon:yes gene_type:complete
MSQKDSTVTELQDIDVHEVSLVDAPAIRRKFLIIKREDPMSDTINDSTPAEAELDATSDPAADATTEADVTKEDVTPAPEETTEQEPVAVAADEPAEVEKSDASEDAPVAVEAEADIEKAKRMTAGRMARLGQMYKELGELLKDLQPPQAGGEAAVQGEPDGKVPNTPPVGQFPASQIVKAEDIEAIVTKAIQPLIDALAPAASDAADTVQKSEAEVETPAADDDAQKAAPASEDPEKAALRKRLSELEATSSAGTANNTDTITKNNTPFWAGIV